MKERYYELIDERVFEQELENGLRLFVIPKPGFQKTFVTYTTQFGSLWIIKSNPSDKTNLLLYLMELLTFRH